MYSTKFAVPLSETTPPTNVASGAARSLNHSVTLNGLGECIVYYYEVQSTDPAGNVASDDNGGQYFRFETLGDFGQGLQPCHAGQVAIQAADYSCSDTIDFELVDIDLNGDPLVVDMAQVSITSSTEPAPEVIVLTETGINTSVFRGTISTGSGAVSADGILQLTDGDLITASYFDSDDGAGFTATSFDTAIADCGGPKITNVGASAITHARATFSWNTDEPSSTILEWGTTPALGNTSQNGTLKTAHSRMVNQFSLCDTIWFRVRAQDEFGNETIADDNGQPFELRIYDIPGLYSLETFENGTNGWTLPGEWEVGAPQGLGGSSGQSDPGSAFNNSSLLGHDLSGQGSSPGDYELNVSENATSPVYNGSSWTNIEMLIHRRLNVGTDDNASIWLSAYGVGRPLFRTDGASNTQTSFETMEVNISTISDGAPDIFLEFRQSSNGSGNYSGWNIDDIIFKDAGTPNYAACNDCGTAPAFAGATSATDNNACGSNGVTVSWQQAPGWGSGNGGSYAIYRDSFPGFTPGPANLVDSGVATLSYNDLAAPLDQTLYYIVRAENDESCSGGPGNGGLLDDNLVSMQVSETTSQSLPGEISGVDVDLVADTHVRVIWPAVGSATSYRVYRSTSPDPATFGLLGETTDLLFDDIGEAANANTYYYRVVGVNACDMEGS